MKCPFKEKTLSEFVDGVLTEERRLFVEKHLDECEVCRKKVDSYKGVTLMLESVPQVKESDDFDFVFNQKLDAAIEAQESSESVFERVFSGIRDFVDSVQMPLPRVPVLVKTAVTFLFMFGAFFTGIYLTESATPGVSGMQGEVYILRRKTDLWQKMPSDTVIRAGDSLRTGVSSEVNIVLASKYHVRLKQNTVIKVAKLTPKNRKGFLRMNLSSGNILVDINKGFKGSKFRVYTPDAEIQALGTKFVVSAAIKPDKTWVGVLEGSVVVQSKEDLRAYADTSKEVLVFSGMKTEVKAGQPPEVPLPLLQQEWEKLSELYMLGQKTKVALLISTNKNRVRELLMPCSIFITDEKTQTLSGKIEEAVFIIREAIKNENRFQHIIGISKMKELVEADPTAEYNVQLLLFIGAYCEYLGLYDDAIKVFSSISQEYPGHPLSSLAECAIGLIYEENIRSLVKAEQVYIGVTEKYPASPEAEFARERILALSKSQS